MDSPMRLFNSVILTRATSSLSFVGFGVIALSALPGEAWSQGGTPPTVQSAAQSVAADSLIEACYVASTGVVYLIKAPGLKAYCATQRHVYLSWRISGAGVPGPIGAVGPAGAVGAPGAVGAAGAV